MDISAPAEPDTVAPPPPELADPEEAEPELLEEPDEDLPDVLPEEDLPEFVEAFGFGLDLALPDRNAAMVLIPAVPSDARPLTLWKDATAALVSSPK